MDYYMALLSYKKVQFWNIFLTIASIIGFFVVFGTAKLSFAFDGDFFGAMASATMIAVMSGGGLLAIMFRRDDHMSKAIKEAQIAIRHAVQKNHRELVYLSYADDFNFFPKSKDDYRHVIAKDYKEEFLSAWGVSIDLSTGKIELECRERSDALAKDALDKRPGTRTVVVE